MWLVSVCQLASWHIPFSTYGLAKQMTALHMQLHAPIQVVKGKGSSSGSETHIDLWYQRPLLGAQGCLRGQEWLSICAVLLEALGQDDEKQDYGKSSTRSARSWSIQGVRCQLQGARLTTGSQHHWNQCRAGWFRRWREEWSYQKTREQPPDNHGKFIISTLSTKAGASAMRSRVQGRHLSFSGQQMDNVLLITNSGGSSGNSYYCSGLMWVTPGSCPDPPQNEVSGCFAAEHSQW